MPIWPRWHPADYGLAYGAQWNRTYAYLGADSEPLTAAHTETTPAEVLVASVESLRAVVSLGSDSSFDTQLETVSRAAQDRVNQVLGYAVQGEAVVDYYPRFSEAYQLTREPAHLAGAINPTTPAKLKALGRTSTSTAAWAPVDLSTIISSTQTAETSGGSHAWEPAGNTVHFFLDGEPGQETDPAACADAWTDDHELSSEYPYPVLIEYQTAPLEYAGPVRLALENFALVLMQQRTGLEIGVPVGQLIKDARKALRPRIRWSGKF